jgi:general secretion pathway protein N
MTGHAAARNLAIAFCLVAIADRAAAAPMPPQELQATSPFTGVIDQQGTTAAAERVGTSAVRAGNPLWGVPLSLLTATRERPIFSSSRRPPPPPVVAAPYVPPKPVPPPPKPVEPEHPRLALVGTIVGDARGLGIFIDENTKSVVRLHPGESHEGWVLRKLERGEAKLEKGSWTDVLALPRPLEQQQALQFAAALPGAPPARDGWFGPPALKNLPAPPVPEPPAPPQGGAPARDAWFGPQQDAVVNVPAPPVPEPVAAPGAPQRDGWFDPQGMATANIPAPPVPEPPPRAPGARDAWFN